MSVNSPTLNIGPPDSTLCEGNIIRLSASPLFNSYTWQDGTTDSVFTITQPGLYYITVITSCGEVLSDSIIVFAAPPVPLYAGSDRIKCNNDTIHLNAPSGFINYEWSPTYCLNQPNSQFAVANPQVDTSYYLKAEKSPGCFGFDTVSIKVITSPNINLGNDTSICYNNLILLNAGTGFSQYNWSTGQTGQTINASAAGIYIIKATALNGCISIDTLTIIKNYSLPTFLLDKTSILCQGSSRILDPGAYSDYIWQNGSHNRTYTAISTGRFYVTVKDNNGCFGSDTVSINSIVPLPASFLPPDTIICNYASATIQASIYSSYLWNTGNLTSKVSIDKEGLYWLTVSDSNNCTGTDSIRLFKKNCPMELFVPTAFTPNGDGRNETLKPLIFGIATEFEFSIYNRYGQLIFSTNNTTIGWDGRVNGIIQYSGSYVWICKYKLAGYNNVYKKGMFTLLK